MPVMEIMTREPITASPDMPVNEAAALMRERGVGSLIVVQGKKAAGIVTERDIVTKVAADNKMPASLKVRDVMTSPVISVHPHTLVEEAARTMNERRIRRLPVVDEGKLVGIVTEDDIIRVWPSLIEITREYARAGMLDENLAVVEGHCDSCGVYSAELMRDGKLLLCPDCRSQ